MFKLRATKSVSQMRSLPGVTLSMSARHVGQAVALIKALTLNWHIRGWP